MNKSIKSNISSIKEKKFTELIKEMHHKPNKNTIDAIDSKTFSLDGNTVFRYKPEILAYKEYERCLSLIEKRIPQVYKRPENQALTNLLMLNKSIINNIFIKEQKHKQKLEQLAVDIIREMFDIPEYIKLLPELCDFGSVDQQEDSPSTILSLSPERQREIRNEVEKRIILNGLVHGCAMHIWKSAHYIVKQKIDEIDSSLMDMYNIYTASIGWNIWKINPDSAIKSIDEEGVTQGKNEIKFSEEGCEIECQGINFPVLLHEVAKGAIDYLICRAIPQDFTEEELTYYYAKSDKYSNEFWHYLLSPTLWTSFIESANVNTTELPEVIARLTKLDYKQLSEVMKGCIDEDGGDKLREFKII